jgi:hypothetical protein
MTVALMHLTTDFWLDAYVSKKAQLMQIVSDALLALLLLAGLLFYNPNISRLFRISLEYIIIVAFVATLIITIIILVQVHSRYPAGVCKLWCDQLLLVVVISFCMLPQAAFPCCRGM